MTKEYYSANAGKIKATAKAWTQKQRKRLKDFVINLKSETKCCLCGLGFPWYVLTIGDREIPRMVSKGVSLVTLANRLSTGTMYCANCRRIHEAQSGLLTDREALS